MMSYQPDPKYFRIGNAFTEGIQQSQDNKRRNALLELEQKQYGLQERGLGLRERAYEDETAERARAMQSQESDDMLKSLYMAYASGKKDVFPRIAQLEGLDEEDLSGLDPDKWVEYGMMKHGLERKPQSPGQLYQIDGPQGPQYVTAPNAVGQRPYQKPADGPTGSWSQPTEVTGSDGKPMLIQTHSVTGETRPVQGYKPKIPPSRQGITPKDATTAKNKINVVRLARQQLNNVRNKANALKGSASAGYGQGWVPSEKGNAFDKAVDQMRSTLTSLTRVPGVGAMSDYETRLDQAKFPNRGDYESVMFDSIEQLDAMLNAIETGYNDLLSEQQPSDDGQQPSWSIEPVP